MAVAAAAGVPGVFMSIAVMEPPYMPPQYIAMSRTIAVTGSIVKVSGSASATPIVAVRPGSAPMMIPTIIPAKSTNRFSKEHRVAKLLHTTSQFISLILS